MSQKNHDTPDGADATLAALANELGLKAAHDIDPPVFAAARNAAKGLSSRMRRTEVLAEEPAHVCRFANRGPRTGRT